MDGKVGTCPPDYTLFQAAKYLGVPPWELMEQSIWWTDRAIMFANAEAEAMQIKQQHHR